jgi:diguanylate cyclase (GGDEF)-like protein
MAPNALAACRATVAALARYAPARISVLLWMHDRLRRVAATGSGQVSVSARPGTGVPGRVFSSGRAETVVGGADHRALGPDVTAEICAPILDPAGRPLGVLDLEWTGPVELDPWRELAERIAARLGVRIDQLGGPPVESHGERLLRHASALTAAASEPEVVAATIEAAREVSGLDGAILVLAGPQGVQVWPPDPTADHVTRAILASLASASPAALDRIASRAHRSGASYTLGGAADALDPAARGGADAEPLHEAGQPAAEPGPVIPDGVGTLIVVPVGPANTGGVLLLADQRVLPPDLTTVNLIELLVAQAWTCLDRLRSLAKLHERAISDPLTGLRHHGPFGERIAAATPGRTALLAIDVDDFKIINDTYGHQAGDQVLVELARALEAALRQGDELYRTGGDEFVAVIEVARPEEAVGIAERLTEAARRIGRTISVGVAVQHDGESPDLTLRRADAALYNVKRAGRDGVRLAAA